MHLAATTSTNPAPSAAPGLQRAVTPSDPVADATTTAAVTNDGCWADLNAGKPLPGPDEWRALERRASSFRLR